MTLLENTGLLLLENIYWGFINNLVQRRLFSVPGNFLSSYLPKMDHRIGIFMLKLVCAENFMLFGLSDRELSYFQNLAFPILSWNFSLQQQIPVKSQEI